MFSTTGGKNLRPSRFYGQKKKPSQSPSMFLLGRIHSVETVATPRGSNAGSTADLTEGSSVSKDYNGEQGRYLPPKHARNKLLSQ